MRTFPAALTAHLAARKPLIVRQALWIEARNRSTGAVSPVGLWTGDGDVSVTVNGTPRTYIGAGGLLDIPEMTVGIGLDVRTLPVTISAIAPEAQQALQGYDARGARCDIYSLFFDPEAPNTLICPPVRRFTGWVDAASQTEEPKSYSFALTLASSARGLSVTLQAFRSDATYRSQRAHDRIARYASVADAPVYWGQARESVGGGGGGGNGGGNGGGGNGGARPGVDTLLPGDNSVDGLIDNIGGFLR